MGDEGALFIPCQCTGSMAHVHPECLAEWRRTAHNSQAFYQCEQCGTNYSIRQNAIAVALLSSNFVIALTVLICTVLTIAAGTIVGALPLGEDRSIPRMLYHRIAYAPPWYTWAPLRSWQPQFDLVVAGMVIISAVGFVFFVRAEWHRNRDHGEEGLMRMGMFIAWLCSVQNEASSRFAVFFGLLFAYSTVFAETRVHAKYFSQKLGETVLAYRPAAAAAAAPTDE